MKTLPESPVIAALILLFCFLVLYYGPWVSFRLVDWLQGR
jgi:hypothetical protein